MISFKLEPKIPSGEIIRGKMIHEDDFSYVNELIYFTCYKSRLKVKKIIPKVISYRGRKITLRNASYFVLRKKFFVV